MFYRLQVTRFKNSREIADALLAMIIYYDVLNGWVGNRGRVVAELVSEILCPELYKGKHVPLSKYINYLKKQVFNAHILESLETLKTLGNNASHIQGISDDEKEIVVDKVIMIVDYILKNKIESTFVKKCFVFLIFLRFLFDNSNRHKISKQCICQISVDPPG